MPDYSSFKTALERQLKTMPGVMGLVWAGSSADSSRADEWSDHDFFVITESGLQEQFRQHLDWLPEAERIAFSARETEHGLKAVYEDGFVIEFAIFDSPELSTAVLNHYALGFGSDELAEILPRIHRPQLGNDARSLDDHLSLFFALLLIGVGRARRGEVLAAGQFVRSYAVTHLMAAIRLVEPSSAPQAQDALDPWRRFEQEFPLIGPAISTALAQPVEDAARALASNFTQLFAQHSSVPEVAYATLAARLGWSDY